MHERRISSGTNKLIVFARHLTFAQVAYYCLENKISGNVLGT